MSGRSIYTFEDDSSIFLGKGIHLVSLQLLEFGLNKKYASLNCSISMVPNMGHVSSTQRGAMLSGEVP